MKFTFAPESRPLEGYTIKRAIYRGGFGEVYYALSDAGREVALKLLQNNTEIELRGVQQCLNLSHPNLVTIFDIRQDGDGDHWIVMEYVAGETLDKTVRRHPNGMPMEQVRQWMNGMCEGIRYLHSRGLVHRDLKPANVFIEDKTVKIGDVGLSKFITASRRSAQTQSVGTVYYMAPEVAKGRYGKEVDIYAMGILLYEMLTGQVPFDGESTGEILMKHLTEAPDLMKLPPRMRGVVSKALAKEPEKRYASIDQLLKAFNDALLGRSEPIDVPDQRAEPVPSPELYQTLPGTPASPRGHDQGFQASLNLQFVTDAGWWVLIGLVILSGLLLNRFLGLGRLSWLTLVTIAALGGLTYLLSSLFKSWRGAMTRSCGYGVPQRTAPIQQASIQTTTSFWEKGVAAVPITGLLTALLAAVKPTVFLNAEGQFPDWGMIGLFSTVAVSGVWGLLLLPAIWTRNSGKLPPGRFAAAMIGIGIGLLAFGVDQYLLLDISTNGDFRGDALYERIADQPLMVRGAGPTALGYILFFGSLFFIRDWALLLRSNRERRFSVASVLWTIAVAWFVTKIFAFPLPLALAWAAVLSCVVQLVSPWAPARQGRVTRLNA